MPKQRDPRSKRWSKAEYTRAANYLRPLGFKLSYKGNRKASPQQKSAVRRAFERSVIYKNENVVFLKLTRRQKDKVKGLVSKRQLTPGGVFLQKPANVPPSKVKFRVNKDGNLEMKTPGRRDVFIRLDPKELAKDPSAAVRKAIGDAKPKHVVLTVNGYEGQASYDLRQFYRYADNKLFPDLFDEDREEGELSPEDVSEIFLVKLVY